MQTTNRQMKRRWVGAALLMSGAALLSGCHIDMWSQDKMKPYYESDFFSDRSEVRPEVPNTVPHSGDLSARLDDVYMTGKDAAGKFVPKIPVRAVRSFASPRAMLERGQDRFNAYCSPCHGYIGDGNGMITQRGLGYWQKLPASYYTDRLRKIEDGYIYDVLVNGKGVMYGYGTRINDVNDRWAVVAYVRALQLAHNANASLAPAGAIKPGEKPVDTTMGNAALSSDRQEDTGTGVNPGAVNGSADQMAPAAPIPSASASATPEVNAGTAPTAPAAGTTSSASPAASPSAGAQ